MRKKEKGDEEEKQGDEERISMVKEEEGRSAGRE